MELLGNKLYWGNEDIRRSGRRLLGGDEDNLLYKTLKNNGYYTAYFTDGSTYIFTEKLAYLDETDIDDVLALLALNPIFDLNDRLNKFKKMLMSNIKPLFLKKLSFPDKITTYISKLLARRQPFFLGFKGGVDHTPSGYTWLLKDEWVASGSYQKFVETGNKDILEIVNFIISNDKNAFIVLLGDHGSWRLRGLWYDVQDWQTLKTRLEDCGESIESLAHDIFGVFMAIRRPGGEFKDIAYGYPLSHANLFRHIFASLSNTPEEIIRFRSPSMSSLSSTNFVLVEEGEIKLNAPAR